MKADTINYLGYLYLKKNMTAREIAEETGYSIYTVKRYLSEGDFRKNDFYSNKETNNKIRRKKYKILSKDEMMKMFAEQQKCNSKKK